MILNESHNENIKIALHVNVRFAQVDANKAQQKLINTMYAHSNSIHSSICHFLCSYVTVSIAVEANLSRR